MPEISEYVGRDVIFTEATEGTFMLPAKDNAISHQIIETGAWAADDVALFRRLIKPGDNVLDIGANIGHHSVVFSKVGGQVYSFEPQQRIFNFLCANLALNSCRNVRPFQVAIGDASGFVKMCPTQEEVSDNWGALPISTKPELQVGELVEISTVDGILALWPMRVDFAKIDVQTFELFVLRGAEKMLRRDHPSLFVEISPYWMEKVNGYDYREIYRFLRGFGYRLLDKNLEPLTEADEQPDPDREWDVVAVY